MRFFNLIVLAVVVLFHANISSLQWVYATSVLVLLSEGRSRRWPSCAIVSGRDLRGYSRLRR